MHAFLKYEDALGTFLVCNVPVTVKTHLLILFFFVRVFGHKSFTYFLHNYKTRQPVRVIPYQT